VGVEQQLHTRQPGGEGRAVVLPDPDPAPPGSRSPPPSGWPPGPASGWPPGPALRAGSCAWSVRPPPTGPTATPNGTVPRRPATGPPTPGSARTGHACAARSSASLRSTIGGRSWPATPPPLSSSYTQFAHPKVKR
jgi:hypothetical protein